MKLLLPIILYFSICSKGIPQDVKIEGYEPRGIFSHRSKYSIDPSLKSSATKLLLITKPNVFLRVPEILQESSGHWKSEAIEVEIHGFDHEYFSVIILIYEETFQAKFEWTSDILPNQQITIEPTNSSLKLNSRGFQKGKNFIGYLEFKGVGRGGNCEGAKFDIRGNFNFTTP